MKNYKLMLAALPFLFILNACSKKDDASPEKLASARIDQIITSSSNSSPGVQSVSYDDQNRNTEWKYEGLRVYRETKDPNNIRVGNLVHQYILNNEGMAIEATSQNLIFNFKRKFTYDDQKRISKITVEEQYVNQTTGTPNTNFKLTDTYDITWSGESNITSIRRTYSGDANTGGIGYWVYNYEGYSSNYLNTLKAVNMGLDIFGAQGYPAILDIGTGGLLYGPFFAGNQLPTKVTMLAFAKNNDPVGDPYVTNYTFEKNAQNRISMLAYDGVTYRFNYR